MAFTLKSKFTVLAGAYLALRENTALHLFNQNAPEDRSRRTITERDFVLIDHSHLEQCQNERIKMRPMVSSR